MIFVVFLLKANWSITAGYCPVCFRNPCQNFVSLQSAGKEIFGIKFLNFSFKSSNFIAGSLEVMNSDTMMSKRGLYVWAFKVLTTSLASIRGLSAKSMTRSLFWLALYERGPMSNRKKNWKWKIVALSSLAQFLFKGNLHPCNIFIYVKLHEIQSKTEFL